MAYAVDPATGRIIYVQDAPLLPGATPTPEQAYSRGQQTTPPPGLASDIPTAGVPTWPLQPLKLSPELTKQSTAATPARTSADLASMNQQLALGVTAAKPEGGVYQPAQRGNYNMYNTNTADLAKPVGAGLNFGFGVNGAPTASEYLQQMRAQDAADSIRRQEAVRRTERAALDSNLAAAVQDGDPLAIRGAMFRLQTYDAANPTATAEVGANARAEMQGLAAQRQLAVQQRNAQLAAQTGLLGRLAAADLSGQYGLAAATAKAQAANQKVAMEAASPAGRKAAAEAALLETQLNAINAAVNANQFGIGDVISATRGGQERQFAPPADPLTGVPYTPEELQLIQRRRTAELQRQTPQ